MLNYKERMEEREIDLIEVMYRIIMKWRQLLVVFILIGALSGVLSAVKSQEDVNEAEIALAEQNKRGGPQEGEELIVVPEFQLINVKTIIFGGIAGSFLYALIPACSYLFSKKLQHEDDLNGIFELHSIACYRDYRKYCKEGSKLDSFICDLFWKNKYRIQDSDQLDVAVIDCVMSMNQNKYSSVCFMSSLNEECEQVKSISKQLSTDFDVNVLNKSIVSSADSLHSIQKYDCVVIVEKIDQSYYEDIIRELEYCDRFNIPVLGTIVIG